MCQSRVSQVRSDQAKMPENIIQNISETTKPINVKL